jgi:putative ABC transport system permease protein
MIRVTLKGLAGRKLRGALTAVAVVLGVAMVSGTFVFTDTIAKAFSGIIAASYANTSAVISPAQQETTTASTTTVPTRLLTDVRALPEVEAAAGGFADLDSETQSITLLDSHGKRLGAKANSPSFGLGIDARDDRFSPLDLDTGRWAAGPAEIVLDAGTAQRHGIAVGDTVGVAALGQAERFQVTGLASFAGVRSLGSATIAVFDVATAQRLFDQPGGYGSISVAAAPGISQQELVDALRPLLPGGAQVRTADELVSAAAADNAEEAKQVSMFLLAFAGIALFVGAFVIANTLSITVAQRTRELATLRTLGANRRQVLGAVLLEALLLGVLASIAGLLLGLGLAEGLDAAFAGLGLDLPKAGMVLAPRTVLVSLLVGTSVTVLASVIPAVRATRVPPILAVREGSALPPARLARYAPYASLALTGAAVAAICYALLGSGLAAKSVLMLLAGGSAALFLGVALLSSRLVRPLAAVVGWPASRLGGAAGRLARANAVRQPGRTAATAAALMIGLTLVTFVAVLGRGMERSVGSTVDRVIDADYVVTATDGYSPLPGAVADAVVAVPAVERVTTVRQDTAQLDGTEVAVSGVDDYLPQLSRIDWADGSNAVLAGLSGAEAVVDSRFAKDHRLHVGDTVALTTAASRVARLEIRGIYRDSLLGPVTMTRQAFDATFPRAQDVLTLVDVAGGASTGQTAALEQALVGFPDAAVATKAGFADARRGEIDLTMNLMYGLLALAVVVSLFGMVNTLALSVFERTRELGMLRAVGMTRRQARRMVRHESVVTALIGAALGLPLGIGLAALVTYALRNEGLVFDLPVMTLAVFVVIAIVCGMLAAIMPARRAARLDPLRALQYE